MKFFLNGIKMPVRKCNKPKMSLHRGRTWDYDYIFINDEKIKAWADTTWGWNIYFEYGGNWWTLPMGSELFKTPQYQLTVFDFPRKAIERFTIEIGITGFPKGSINEETAFYAAH